MKLYILIICILILFFTLMIMFSTNPIHVVFWFIILYLHSAMLLLLMGQEYMSLTLIMIYMGAMTMVFLFVMMMLDMIELKNLPFQKSILPLTLIMIVNTSSQLLYMENLTHYKETSSLNISWHLEELEKLNTLGLNLYTDFFMFFVLMTIILMMGLMAVILLSLENNKLNSKQDLGKQQSSNNSWT